jgi:hypothetical protein
MNVCPCEECVVFTVCKHKDYKDLINDCEIIRRHLYNRGICHSIFRVDVFKKRASYINKLMKSEWKLEQSDDGRIYFA